MYGEVGPLNTGIQCIYTKTDRDNTKVKINKIICTVCCEILLRIVEPQVVSQLTRPLQFTIFFLLSFCYKEKARNKKVVSRLEFQIASPWCEL